MIIYVFGKITYTPVFRRQSHKICLLLLRYDEA